MTRTRGEGRNTASTRGQHGLLFCPVAPRPPSRQLALVAEAHPRRPPRRERCQATPDRCSRQYTGRLWASCGRNKAKGVECPCRPSGFVLRRQFTAHLFRQPPDACLTSAIDRTAAGGLGPRYAAGKAVKPLARTGPRRLPTTLAVHPPLDAGVLKVSRVASLGRTAVRSAPSNRTSSWDRSPATVQPRTRCRQWLVKPARANAGLTRVKGAAARTASQAGECACSPRRPGRGYGRAAGSGEARTACLQPLCPIPRDDHHWPLLAQADLVCAWGAPVPAFVVVERAYIRD